MNPVFKEYGKFLKDTCGLELEEGYYWLDNQIIKCFDYEGNIHKLYRLKINDDLSMTYSKPKDYSTISKENIEPWKSTILRNFYILEELEKESLSLIKEALNKYNDCTPEILTSGGKDSSVTMHLVRKVKESIHAIGNNTTLDCSDTYKHFKTLSNFKLITPNEGFYQWRERIQFIPTRFARACCTKFKEGAMMDYLDKDDIYIFFLGMRNEESSARSGYEDYWRNEKWTDGWNGCLPIRKWTELEIWLYIMYNNISVNEKYKKGYARVGCAIACPYYTKSTWVLDKYWYPKMYKRWHNILDNDFEQNNKDLIMNCTQSEYHSCWNGGTLRKEPTKEVIEQYAERNGLDINIAEKYFNHTCECGKRIKSKEVLAMNMKFHGRNVNKFFCKKCLIKELNLSKEEWNNNVERFKQQGCELF